MALWGRSEWRARRDVQRLDKLEEDYVTRAEFAANQRAISELQTSQVTRQTFDQTIGELRGSMLESLRNSFVMLRNHMDERDQERRAMHQDNRDVLLGLQRHLKQQDAILGHIRTEVAVLQENKRLRERAEDHQGDS